jgi:transposase-like protein
LRRNHLYRAVDREGNTVDFRLSSKPDVAAVKAFFREAIKGQGSTVRTITLDGCAASHRAMREMKAEGQMPTDTKLRSTKYLYNLIEQDHRGVKSASVRCPGLSNSSPQRSQLPVLNCCAASGRDSSTSAGCASTVELHLPSGILCCIGNKMDVVGRRHCPAPPLVYLHPSY